jgi:hypothetical protein
MSNGWMFSSSTYIDEDGFGNAAEDFIVIDRDATCYGENVPSHILNPLVGVPTLQTLIIAVEFRISFFQERPTNRASDGQSNEQ